MAFPLLLLIIICALGKDALGVRVEGDDLVVGVVQYTPKGNGDFAAFETNMRNYIDILQTAHEKKINVLVFPEQGLTGPPEDFLDDCGELKPFKAYLSNDTELWDTKSVRNESWVQDLRRKYLELAAEFPVDFYCGQHFDLPKSQKLLTRLACAARILDIFVVVNCIEKVPCNDTEGCPDDGVFLYNTNLVFGPSDSLVARYRKFNIIDEPWFDTSPESGAVTFTTYFNVTFGLMIGSDYLHPYPTNFYVRDPKVTTVILTTRPFDRSFLVSVQDHSSWAHQTGIKLIVAGYSWDGAGGIYNSYGEPIFEYLYVHNWDNILYQSLPIKFYQQRVEENQLTYYEIVQNTLIRPYYITSLPALPKENSFHNTSSADMIKYSDVITYGHNVAYMCLDDNFCCQFNAFTSYRQFKESIFFTGDFRHKFVIQRIVYLTPNNMLAIIELCGVVICRSIVEGEWICGDFSRRNQFSKVSTTLFEVLVISHQNYNKRSSFYSPMARLNNRTLINNQEYTFFNSENNSAVIMYLNEPQLNLAIFGIVSRSYKSRTLQDNTWEVKTFKSSDTGGSNYFMIFLYTILTIILCILLFWFICFLLAKYFSYKYAIISLEYSYRVFAMIFRFKGKKEYDVTDIPLDNLNETFETKPNEEPQYLQPSQVEDVRPTGNIPTQGWRPQVPRLSIVSVSSSEQAPAEQVIVEAECHYRPGEESSVPSRSNISKLLPSTLRQRNPTVAPEDPNAIHLAP